MTTHHLYRDCNLAELAGRVGQMIKLAGFIHAKRDHGQLLFIELRDHYAKLQCVIDVDHADFKKLQHLRVESTVSLTGQLIERAPETQNHALMNGKIEFKIEGVTVLTEAAVLPFPVDAETNAPEEQRLKYRYVDLRHEALHARIVERAKIIAAFRKAMTGQGFVDVQTPILTASSPEGARDFLVPSRMYPGKFYALPQAPQQFKQMLMVANFDKYFQIAPCFRDEDTRADRVFEFYQVDYEMAFATREDVWRVSEAAMSAVFKEFAPKSHRVDEAPFRVMSYDEAMRDYGCDKPDLRNPLVLKDVSQIFAASDFSIFANLVKAGGVVLAVPAPKSSEKSRSWFDNWGKWATDQGMAGLGYLTFESETAKGPVGKKLTAAELERLKLMTGSAEGDTLFFVASQKLSEARGWASALRKAVGEDLGLVDTKSFQFAWVTDFPFFELDSEGTIDFAHNPFSMPQGDREDVARIFESGTLEEKLALKAYQYDLVCNGYEISSGGVRQHQPEMLIKAFEVVGYKREEVLEKFAGIIGAYDFGAPAHAGAALGLDRIIMILTGEPNLRQVIAFPISQRGQDILMNAPAEATPRQLKELGLTITPVKK